jgi:hypothetical protein
MTAPPEPAVGFMGQPVQAKSVADLTREPDHVPVAEYDWEYKLPDSVMDSAHWKGTPSDLYFAFSEPTLAQTEQLGRRSLAAAEVISDFVRAIGERDADGNAVLEPTGELDAKGQPVMAAKLRPVTHIEATAWLHRLGTKGVTLACQEWASTFTPSNAEGEATRASKRRGRRGRKP